MPIISSVGLFYYDKFEETPNEKVVNMSKLTKPYFNKELNRALNMALLIRQLVNECSLTYSSNKFLGPIRKFF